MWSYIKKAVNSKLEKAIDEIIVEKTNSSYNKGEYVSLNKMIEGEKQYRAVKTEPELLHLQSSDFNINTIGDDLVYTQKIPFVAETSGTFLIIVKVGRYESGNTSTSGRANFILYRQRENSDNKTQIYNANYTGLNLNYKNYEIDIPASKGDKIYLEYKTNNSSNKQLQLSDYQIYAEEKQIPYITIIDKESE